MAVIGAATATVVASLVGIFMVNIILHEASHTELAPYGKGKRNDFHGLSFDTGGKANRR
jgi:Na+-driven multidrug efflux pump